MGSRPFFFLSLFILGSISATARVLTGDERRYQTVDLNDPYVAGIANFVVSQHNEDAKDNLVLSNIVSVKKDDHLGSADYYVIFKASINGGASHTYKADVFDFPAKRYRQLESFVELA